MTRVALIVTGELEKKALGESLRRMFDDVELTTEMRSDGFTSPRLSLPLPEGRETNADKLARRMIAAVHPGRGEQPADFAVVVEDLELENDTQPDVIVAYFREAVRRQLDKYGWASTSTEEKIRKRVRERCSFHLLAPMVETYFFAEHEALQRAGAIRACLVDASAIDLEKFETNDPVFLQPDDGKFDWAKPQRARHPKHYLQFLCDPEGRGISRYRETKGGVKALTELDWSRVMAPSESVRFLRSLFHDLADALDQEPSFPGTCHELTMLGAGESLLRNL